MVTIHPNLTTLDVKGNYLFTFNYYTNFNSIQFNLLVGQVTIDLQIEKDTNFIVLHIQDLNVTEKVTIRYLL